MAKRPLVSVLMTACNHEQFVHTAFDSVLRQSFDDFEILIADDASMDQSPVIIAEYAKKYSEKILAIYHQKNMGIIATHGELLEKVRGKYVAFLAGDDVYLPGKLAKQTAVMESQPDCILSYHDVEVFNSDDGATIKFWNKGPGSSLAREGDTSRVVRAMLENFNDFMLCGTAMVRRDAIDIDSWNYADTSVEDMVFLIDIVARNRGKVLYIPEVLLRYRRHANSITARMTAAAFHGAIRAALDQLGVRNPPLARYAERGIGLSFYREGIICLRLGRYHDAASLFKKVGGHTSGRLAIKARLRLLECQLGRPLF